MKHTPEKRGKLRALGKPVYIFAFPVIFALLFTAFASYCESYYRTEFPVWGCLFLIPLALLGIAAGCQLQMYPEKHLGKKAEMIVGIVIAVLLIAAFYYEYQYFLVPQAGLPPLSRKMIPEALRRRLPFG